MGDLVGADANFVPDSAGLNDYGQCRLPVQDISPWCGLQKVAARRAHIPSQADRDNDICLSVWLRVIIGVCSLIFRWKIEDAES
jgi:hypothetical protein